MNQAKVDYKKIEIVSSMFSDHSPLRLDTKYRKKNNNNKTKLKNTNTWRLNIILLNEQEVSEEIKEEIKTLISRLIECNKSSVKREIYCNTNLPQETRKTSNKEPNLVLTVMRKRRPKAPKLVEGVKSQRSEQK